MNYTKGEWRVGYKNWGLEPVVIIGDDVNPAVIASCSMGIEGGVNARLISAAPDMYEALKEIFESRELPIALANMAMEALSKAEDKEDGK
jgi:hypothetical protein